MKSSNGQNKISSIILNAAVAAKSAGYLYKKLLNKL